MNRKIYQVKETEIEVVAVGISVIVIKKMIELE